MVYVIYEDHREGQRLCSNSDCNYMSDTVTWVPIFQKNLRLPSSGYPQLLVIFSRHGLFYYDVSNSDCTGLNSKITDKS